MKIAILPQCVVDRIAAGEVVQRLAACVKELVENSLDAGATEIKVQTDGLNNVNISDDGCGIDKEDLELAAVRHATSKLIESADLSSIQSFGFRGEALASISMVSRLSIVSKTDSHPAAYKLSYLDGNPTTDRPIPTARTKGTTVQVQDLFYNMPNRKKIRLTEEYNATLRVLQYYAIHYAKMGISFQCRKDGNRSTSKTDLNTSNLTSTVRGYKRRKESKEIDDSVLSEIRSQATKDVIAHVFGSQILPFLTHFDCELLNEDRSSKATTLYKCESLFTSVAYRSSKVSQFILFVNNRLVDGCAPLKRAIEGVYAEFKKEKPLLYMSLIVPADQVDVNVHPTKREVALMHMDTICGDIVAHLRRHLSEQGQSFSTQSVDPSSNLNTGQSKRKQTFVLPTTQSVLSSGLQILSESLSKGNGKPPPNKLIRTDRSTQSGSLEPFLVTTQRLEGKNQDALSQPLQDHRGTSSIEYKTHHPGCPLFNVAESVKKVDMNIPGAFAGLARQCRCNNILVPNELLQDITLQKSASSFRKPTYVSPFPCTYSSIQSLRNRIKKRADSSIQSKIRSSCFVGVLSHYRSLIQCGEELVMISHSEFAREMFYQLALNRFGSGDFATFGDSVEIDVEEVVGKIVQLEELIHSPEFSTVSMSNVNLMQVKETNTRLAEQVSQSLLENATMLKEYFSMTIVRSESGRVVLSTLPNLLSGHEPSPHGIPLFLLRLATEVNWKDEKVCFHGICEEIASYYSQIPSGATHSSVVRHVIFPAVSSLLIPSSALKQNKHFVTLATLPRLYRVFERC